MAYTGTSLSVHVKVIVEPSNSEAFLKALEPTFRNVIAEPLNIFCEVYQDEKNPGVFRFVENWNATLDHMMNVSGRFHFESGVVPARHSCTIKTRSCEDAILSRPAKQVQRHKPYYKHYREVVEPLFIKPQEVEIFSRMPGNEWASIRTEFYRDRS